MIKWKVSLDVSYYTVDYFFEDADEAVAFAREAMKGIYHSSTTEETAVTVRIEAVFPEKEEADE